MENPRHYRPRDFPSVHIREATAESERRGRYNVERLIGAHGADAKLAYLLATLPDCLKASSISVPDRCNAVYEGL